MADLVFLSLIFAFALNSAVAKFDIIWNVPSFLCSKNYNVNLTQKLLDYEILVNNKESFIGDKIALFYEDTIGKYPRIDPVRGDINGGLPLMEKLGEHLKKTEADIQSIIKDPNFNGLGVIDWESWRPSWDYLWGTLKVYKNRQLELIKEFNSTLSVAEVRKAAKSTWEYTAKQWMLKTLQLAKRLRPEGKWCYYLFPSCYNYEGKDHPSEFFCSDRIRSVNDELSWMWEESTALCPSIYLYADQLKYNSSQRMWYQYGKLAEAMRVSHPNTEIYPYSNYIVPDLGVPLDKDQFWKMLALTASMGLDGFVIWGSSSYLVNRTACEFLESYVDDVIGPAATRVSSSVERCSKTICNGKGRCTWPEEPFTSWEYLTSKRLTYFDSTKIVCRCQAGKGRYCL